MRAGPVLTVGLAPAFALHWLIPRLAKFNHKHPDVEVRMATGGARVPLRDDWTCSVRRGEADQWPGYLTEELFPVPLVPICTPTIAKCLHRPADLKSATLIVVAHLRAQWTWWFDAAGLPAIRPAGEVVFESSAMAIKAVLDGVGVAVAQLPYVSDELASGRLVAPFPIVEQRFESWYLAYRPIRQSDSALVLFRDWLHHEAKLQRQQYELLTGR